MSAAKNFERPPSVGFKSKKTITPSSRGTTEDSFRRYLKEIRRYKLLDREGELELAKRYRFEEDRGAGKQLITSNLRLVVKIAMEYRSSNIALLDLIQEGNVGLMKAVKKFDPAQKIRLSSYAQWWIRAYILKYLMDNYKLIKIGTTQAQRRLFYNLKKEQEKILSAGEEVTTERLAVSLNVRERDVIEMQARLSGREVSIDAPIKGGDSGVLIDFMASSSPYPDALYVRSEIGFIFMKKLRSFAKTLSGRDVEIWERRLLHHEPATLQQLGDTFGVSRERARQLEARILSKLRVFISREMKGIDMSDVSFPLFH